MGRQAWINHMLYFQAWCRGYLIRKELKCVHAEYEAMVRELEGSVDHLSWRGKLVPKPHFTDGDKDNPFFRYPQPKIQTQEIPASVEEVKVQGVLVPEKDEEPRYGPEQNCRETNTPPEGDGEMCEGVRKDCVAETAAQTLHMSNSILQHAPPMHTLLKDVAHTPEALKQHRNTLAMELLWIQQAIASRKKYLTLKQKMETS